MVEIGQTMSTSGQIHHGSKFNSGNNSRPSSKDGSKKNIWSSLLDSVANGKRLPEKNLLILGGTPESQREFLETFSADTSDPNLSNEQRKGRIPPVANQFALGYTYQDVLDADHEVSLDDETKIVMEETMTEWRDRKRGMDASSAGAQGLTSSGGPADKIEKLERDHGWHEEQFDFILQFLRTILLKHGASLIYTTPFLANSLQSLLHSSLGIHSLLKRQSLKHNVIDRDKILVPANWDSWGKIRIIREGFDMEGVSTAWSIEIQDLPEPLTNGPRNQKADDDSQAGMDDGTSAVAIFEQTITDPKCGTSMARPGSQQSKNKIEVETTDMQNFLSKQQELLEQLKIEDEKDRTTKKTPQLEMSPLEDNGRVNEHIGPVQFNMGGIQVDADDMLRKLKEREVNRSQRKDTISSPGDEKAHNQALANFFAGLVKKPSGSPRGSPSA
ncbi:hypothetical protein EYZ11_009887 [Aspergillus tanneri]|uniref:Dynein light intermediate chain n=1 Tax=Aspergillus tanneri TaxID=1220188 RepID=A0A4S3J6R1_9EURO|nr:hypothetical protein EYZ11_009887 [Aspergillus tanneri]